MNNNAQSHLNQIIKKEWMYYLDLCNRDLSGDMDLKDFTNLKSLNASNNKFTNLDFLNSLSNKEKLTSINLFGNEIQNLDLNLLLENFPNLKMVNLDNNPLSLQNLEQLSSEQLNSLVNMVENKKLRISTWKGTLTLDLLKAIQELKEKTNQSTNNSNNSHSQTNQLSLTNSQSVGKPNKDNNNSLLLIPVIVGSLLVGSLFTYLFLKRKTKTTK